MRQVLATAPSWFNVDNLKFLAIGVIVVLIVFVLLVVRFIQKIATKLAMVLLLVGLGAAVYTQRANLSDCAKNCHCTVFGQDVRLPSDLEQHCRQLGKLPAAGTSSRT